MCLLRYAALGERKKIAKVEMDYPQKGWLFLLSFAVISDRVGMTRVACI